MTEVHTKWPWAQDNASAFHNMKPADFEREMTKALPAVDRCISFNLGKFVYFLNRFHPDAIMALHSFQQEHVGGQDVAGVSFWKDHPEPPGRSPYPCNSLPTH